MGTESTDAVVRIPCGHHFHRGCVKRWLVSGPDPGRKEKIGSSGGSFLGCKEPLKEKEMNVSGR